ncbi:MAG: multiheme c-type cytochrome, partial [Myxococcota bacterium]|nr:multiheme c-type cytochrome [Myxococcota bacterium]
GFPAINATWTDTDGAALLPASAVVERDGVRLGVIGLSAASMDRSVREQVQMLPIPQAIRRGLDELPEDLDLIVGLGSIDRQDAAALTEEHADLSMILLTSGQHFDDAEAQPSGHPLIVEAPDRGRYVQLVRLNIGTSSNEPVILLPDSEKWRELSLLRGQLRAGRTSSQDALSVLEQEFREVGAGRNLGMVETYPLGEHWDGPATVDEPIDQFKSDRLAMAVQTAARTQEDQSNPAYASSSACLTCHSSEFARWTLTGHTRAWQSIIQRGETENPECIGCHTTGYGEAGGWGELTRANIRKFKGIQCEACHGPLAGHPQNSAASPHPVQPSTCLPCHDEANSPDFDYEKDRSRSTCQGGAPSAPE